MRTSRSMLIAILFIAFVAFAGYSAMPKAPTDKKQGIEAFSIVEQVFQHPRCSNCHIPGDAPLQFDTQTPHMMNVVRGPKGTGSPALPCSACHQEQNAPDSYGPNAPPGAPNWHLPPPDQKMAWIGVSATQLCDIIKDRKRNGNRDLPMMLEHVSTDKLVLWGWQPGGNRQAVPVPHDVFITAFKTWMDAGAPCP
ncbi:TPA: hypothetical protein ACKQDN_001837 [Serratia marcescens]